jgi:hypothetical protein
MVHATQSLAAAPSDEAPASIGDGSLSLDERMTRHSVFHHPFLAALDTDRVPSPVQAVRDFGHLYGLLVRTSAIQREHLLARLVDRPLVDARANQALCALLASPRAYESIDRPVLAAFHTLVSAVGAPAPAPGLLEAEQRMLALTDRLRRLAASERSAAAFGGWLGWRKSWERIGFTLSGVVQRHGLIRQKDSESLGTSHEPPHVVASLDEIIVQLSEHRSEARAIQFGADQALAIAHEALDLLLGRMLAFAS